MTTPQSTGIETIVTETIVTESTVTESTVTESTVTKSIVPKSIVPGIQIDSSGQALIDPSVQDLLFDLAIQLEDPTGLPVDIEHVVAAIVLAIRHRQIDADQSLAVEPSRLVKILTPHVRSVFRIYDGNLGRDD